MGTARPAVRQPPGTPGRVPELEVPALVGRERELAELTAALARPPALVLVEGEAGVGKSRLLREFLAGTTDLAGAAGSAGGAARTLVASCPPYRTVHPLGPVVDAVRRSRDTVATLPVSPLAGALRPLFPEWAADLPPAPEQLDDREAARHRRFGALAELLDCLATAVLAVEDAHWADAATLELLLFLATRQRLSLIVSYRPEDVPAGSLLPQLASWAPSGRRPARLTLPALDRPTTAQLISSMLDGPVSGALAGFLHQRTGGVPLLLEESVRLLRDRGELARPAGRWIRKGGPDLPVPPTVRDAVQERWQRLGPAAQRVLAAAAVIAGPAGETTLARVAGLSRTVAGGGLAELLRSGWLGEDDLQRARFRHELIRQAVYRAIPAPERRKLHRAAGAVLAATQPAPVAAVLHHVRAGQDTGRWCRYAELAAEAASATGDYTAAMTALLDALEGAGPPPPVRIRLAERLGTAALQRAERIDELHQRAIAALERTLSVGGLPPAAEGGIRNRLGRLRLQQGDVDRSLPELERAAGLLADNPREAALVMSCLGLPLGRWPTQRHRTWLRRAGAVDPAALAEPDRLAVSFHRVMALLHLGEAEGWSVVTEVSPEVVRSAEPPQLARWWLMLGQAAVRWGRYPEARRYLAMADRLAHAVGLERIWLIGESIQAQLDWLAGAWAGLEARATAVIGGADGSNPGEFCALRAAGLLAAARGRRREADERLRRALDGARSRGNLDETQEPAAALARLLLREGRPGPAVELTDDPMAVVAGKGIWIWGTEIAPVRVEALFGVGRAAEAERLVSSFGHGLRGRDAPAARAALALCRAILLAGQGETLRAGAGFARAAREWDRLRRPYDGWLAREHRAGCLLAAGRPEPGVALLAEVHRGLDRLGASGDASRVAAALREHGVQVRRSGRAGRPGYGDQVSPRELEVTRLVAAGATNREIAQSLSRSPSTVATQLNSAMRKLRVSSRTALAVAAVEAGLVAPAGRRSPAAAAPSGAD